MRALLPRLGADFSKLRTAGAVFAQQLPWLLFALLSGAWTDRLNRRRLVVTVNLVRAAALATLAAAVATRPGDGAADPRGPLRARHGGATPAFVATSG